ncbi:Transposable element tcb2 transposase [Caligus rogercresseyi]|uniref:Transposable element tcb2 transposase n=1 Tax=Caligus rogercresseyi TaxID=217165 RepID=A0A7T8HEF9_CALRO|nr:Transposable element tcb2 transposase [Caligus rogercresseyi]
MKANPGAPISILARKRWVHLSTVSRVIKKDLGYKSYALRIRHLLTDSQKARRVAKGKKLLVSLKTKCTGHLRFFSDEKVFSEDRSSNRWNDRWICRDPKDVPLVFRIQSLASIMVLGVICSNGSVMPPHFFGPKEKVNSEAYLNVLKTVVVPWMNSVASGTPYTFQQDSAPAHKTKLVQSWLKKNVFQLHLAPNSPDLNPCFYYL